MSLRKRISQSRERSARDRAKRREERRRAERAKAGATAADRSKARLERKKAKGTPKPEAEKPKEEPKRAETPQAKAGKPKSEKPKPKAKVAAAKPSRFKSPAKRPALAAGAGKVGTGIRSVVAEVLKLGREMIAIPVQLWLAAAEIAGAVVLRAWLKVVRPTLLWLWTMARSTLRFAQNHIRPAHGVIACTVVAIGALAASQWLDYHQVTVGTDAYSGTVGEVAPAPEVESDIAGSAHAWIMLPLAVLALIVLTIALTGRRKAAALLIPIGLAAIAVTLIVDLPKGLDEGTASVAYEGASASLLEGFWMQIAAAVVLIGCGLLLPRYLRPETSRARAAPTGPTLFQSGAAAAGRLAKRRPKLKRPQLKGRPRRARPRRKVQGARP
jgi:hypothetical protein